MDLVAIISELETERDRLNRAIAILQRRASSRGPGSAATQRSNGKKGKKRSLSAEARRRISEGMKKRWVERKKKA